MKIRRCKGKIEPKKDTLKDRLEKEYAHAKTTLANRVKDKKKTVDTSYKIGFLMGILSSIEIEYRTLYKVPIPNKLASDDYLQARELTNKDNQSKELSVRSDTIKEQIEELTNTELHDVLVERVHFTHDMNLAESFAAYPRIEVTLVANRIIQKEGNES